VTVFLPKAKNMVPEEGNDDAEDERGEHEVHNAHRGLVTSLPLANFPDVGEAVPVFVGKLELRLLREEGVVEIVHDRLDHRRVPGKKG